MVDAKKFYLNNATAKHEYYNISFSLTPQEVIDEYKLMDKQISGFLYVMLQNRMYGLFQAEIIAIMALKKHLWTFGNEPEPITLELWRHNKNGITFTLVVVDFGIK